MTRWVRPGAAIALLSALAVGGLIWNDFHRTAPGAIAAVHARVPELAGDHCAKCHGGWFGSMTPSCLKCHEVIQQQIDDHRGLHGTMQPQQAAACATCHSEHHGFDFQMVNRQSFALAGTSVTEFDHRRVGWEMAGKHLELDCAKCHELAHSAILPEGGRRYIGLDQDCKTCHDDPHEGRMAQQCADCHGQEKFDELHAVGHDKVLPLIGGHAGLECRKCHEKDGPNALELEGRDKVPARTCVDCHESPHGLGFVEGVADLQQMPTAKVCVVCHEPPHQSFRDERLTVNAQQHAVSGFPIDPPHDKVKCQDCHGGDGTFDARYPGRSADQCVQCHRDVHAGQFAGGPFADVSCTGCHDPLHWEPHAFTPELHDKAALPLDGAHLKAKCEDCHQLPAGSDVRVFRGTDDRCDTCHQDAHGGYFDRRLASAPPVAHGQCAQCHVTASFSQPADGFDHGAWTGFPLNGAHAQEACESCHGRADKPDEHGRTFGHVEDRYGRVEGCNTCHQDPHQGAFDELGMPHVVKGKTGCARCHAESSFRTFPGGFDHQRWTGFPLRGAHEKASCTACHAKLIPPDEHGRTWQAAVGKECQDCHEDPHAGQFTVRGQVNCARCHRSDDFHDLAFQHDLHSRFQLGEPHKSLPCASCHKPTQVDGREVVRYRPIAHECVDCHGAQDDPLRRGKGGKR